MDILEKLSNIKITFTFDNLLINLLILFIIVWLVKFIHKLIKNRVKIKSITISGLTVDLECNDSVKKLANDVWIELSTRKIALPFDEENDVIIEVYNSWYTVFERFREILKKVPMDKNKDVDKLVNIIL